MFILIFYLVTVSWNHGFHYISFRFSVKSSPNIQDGLKNILNFYIDKNNFIKNSATEILRLFSILPWFFVDPGSVVRPWKLLIIMFQLIRNVI